MLTDTHINQPKELEENGYDFSWKQPHDCDFSMVFALSQLP